MSKSLIGVVGDLNAAFLGFLAGAAFCGGGNERKPLQIILIDAAMKCKDKEQALAMLDDVIRTTENAKYAVEWAEWEVKDEHID